MTSTKRRRCDPFSNWIDEAKVLRAVRLVTTGTMYELAHLYERGMPLYGDRTFALQSLAAFPPFHSRNASTWFIDFFSGEFGQLGTQLDARGHVGPAPSSRAASCSTSLARGAFPPCRAGTRSPSPTCARRSSARA